MPQAVDLAHAGPYAARIAVVDDDPLFLHVFAARSRAFNGSRRRHQPQRVDQHDRPGDLSQPAGADADGRQADAGHGGAVRHHRVRGGAVS